MKASWLTKCAAFCLAAVLAVPCMGVDTAQAAKASLSSTTMTIGIGSYGYDAPLCSKTETRYTLSVSNAKKGASYTFTSSNKKVLTVKSKGKTCYITGVKAGTAKVKVTQKLKGKTTNVGTCKVSVKKASLTKYQPDTISVGGGNVYVSGGNGIVGIQNLNPAAKYTFKTNSSNLTIKQKLVSAGDMYGIKDAKTVYQTYRAKKAGTYKVTVKETYKKQTRTLGTLSVVVDPIAVPDTLTIYTGMTKTAEYQLVDKAEYISNYVEYAIEDTSIVSCTDGEYGTHTLTGLSAGSTKWSVYAVKDDGTRGDLIGECTITVKDPVVTGISIDYAEDGKMDIYLPDPEDDEDDGTSRLYYTIEMEDDLYAGDFGDTYTSQVKVTSGDESIVSVVYDEEYDEYYLKAVKAGTTKVTITCGSVSSSVDVTVKNYSDYDYDDEDEDY